MTQAQANRRRGRPRRGGPRPSEPQVNGNTASEDSRTFWERSNARLGVEHGGEGAQGRRGRGPVEYPCAVCGAMVMMDRWPRHRHEVRCDLCRQTVNQLVHDDADDLVPERPRGNGRHDGLPEMTPEDLEALAEIRAARGGSDARAGIGPNRHRRRGGPFAAGAGPSPAGGPPRRQGPPPPAAASGNGDSDAPVEKADGGGRRRRRRRRGGPGAPGPAPTGEG